MRDDVAPARVRCAPLCVLRFVAANGTLLASLHFRAAIVRFPILHFLGLVWLCVLTVCVCVDELSALVRRGASDALNADAAAALRMVSFFFFLVRCCVSLSVVHRSAAPCPSQLARAPDPIVLLALSLCL